MNTDHILFIASGAFHSCKPSDMLAELQGRLPIRVELKGLTKHDLYRILTEPAHNMIRQQQALMATEGIDLVFTDAAVHEIASVAHEVNRTVDNIGARRLHTVLERIVEDVRRARARAAAAGGYPLTRRGRCPARAQLPSAGAGGGAAAGGGGRARGVPDRHRGRAQGGGGADEEVGPDALRAVNGGARRACG